MKVIVHNYRACSGHSPEIINDVEFDDALRMIHPDAAWAWDRDGHQLHGASVTVKLWYGFGGVISEALYYFYPAPQPHWFKGPPLEG